MGGGEENHALAEEEKVFGVRKKQKRTEHWVIKS